MSNFKLSKQDIDRRASLVASLHKATGEIERAVAAYNATLTEEWELVKQAINDYNGALEEARGFAGDIGRQAAEDFDGKTDKWQESERGEAAAQWRDDWQGIDLDAPQIDQPDALDITDQLSHADELEALPVELEA